MTAIAIIGAGAFGTALAVTLAQQGPVILWARDLRDMARDRENRARLPGVPLPTSLSLTQDLADLSAASIVLVALPMQQLGAFLARNATHLDGRSLVACSKGVDLASGKGPSALLAQACPGATVAVLTGPSFAADIARGLPTALTLACADPVAGPALQAQLSTPALRLYRSTDLTGAELGGAVKNVIAIAAGMVMGAGLGDSARAALMTRGYAEMLRLAVHLGARPETLAGLSGLGDLVLTCTSDLSRNFRFGRALGAGSAPEEGATVEGVATARAITALARNRGIDMPITTMVAAVVGGELTVADAMTALMARPLKEE
ncbi:NAD(P)H-dependent glycerol-3-phosphate dehydrogenase [Plastorhodobacter daqingensis]|uniref:Glycerol-3-phosphate dehydrogenase [NAD(P)+] n=1 Tax=Plastorhodobacter daqingensis TaxID=1387281 RepID=A0ABW2UGP3_9RHOB